MSSQTQGMLEHFSAAMLNPTLDQGMDVGSAMRAMEGTLDARSAAKVIAHKKDLPPDLQSMVQTISRGGEGGEGDATGQEFSEDSLLKARVVLNEMITKAWGYLDDLIIKCKTFEDRNRAYYAQVTRDIARLIEQINDLERIESEAVEGINTKDMEIKQVEDLIEQETANYESEFQENSRELTIRQNDMDVFQFIMVFTKCPDTTSLAEVEVCETSSGEHVLKFKDKAKNAKYDKLLTPSAKRRVDNLLQSIMSQTPRTSTTLPPPPPPGAKTEVQQGMDSFTASMKCGREVPDCGLLHDKMSLMWGVYKDQVDELTMIMEKNEYEFKELKTNLNNQIDVLKTAKARLNELLGEARSNLAADNEELKQKYLQKTDLDRDYTRELASCKKKISWIFYQDMCAIKVVRNAVHENSTVCPPEAFEDCDVSGWIGEECSVSCDDSCDYHNPIKCGGWQKIHREKIQGNNTCGVECPRFDLWRRCGQFPCPVDCEMTAWSGWSKCSAECGGGVQGHTRSIAVKPKNGGLSCNTVEESRPCATGSCDRNCILAKWTDWTPCSQACTPKGGISGFQEKYRHVALPTRGFGKCPTEHSRYRFSHRQCNTHQCSPPMHCIAQQDLVVAIDGSGSMRQFGFEILRKFVKAFLSNYETMYFGEKAVQLSIVQFGNGVIEDDGKTVSPARLLQPLTFDMSLITKALDEMEFKRGFTNLAQGFEAAEKAITLGARRSAQSAILVITDGKPSFNFQTTEMVEQLDDKGVQRYFLLVETHMADLRDGGVGLSTDPTMATLMRRWASQPWETNIVSVPSLDVLDADTSIWAEKALVQFCPEAYSPSEAMWEEANYGYAHVKDGGYCGEMEDYNLLATDTESAETCAALVSGAGGQSFMLGISWARGKCYMGTMQVDSKQFHEWQMNRKDPACPEQDGWHSSALFDFYAMEPVSDEY